MYSWWILLIIILVSSIPMILVYIWYRLAKYDISLIRFLLILLAGAAAFFPALILQDLLNFSFSTDSRTVLFYHVFIRVAFTEELSRLLILFIFFFVSSRLANYSPEQPSWLDIKKGYATGLVAGLGFAILENAVYAASDTSILILRTVTAAPLHAACGSRVGAAATMVRTNPIQAFFRLLTAVAIHGIYNFMSAMPGISSIAAVLIAITALTSSILSIRGNWKSEEEK
jgi:RsiW-degrading membrane proteinase PrsW (M82 family)